MSKTPQPRCNQQIRSQTVRLIDNHGEQHGEVDIKLAMSMAREADLDLVEVAPDAKPPVVKIMDQGRERYRQEKRERSQRKVRSHAHQLRLRLGEGRVGIGAGLAWHGTARHRSIG